MKIQEPGVQHQAAYRWLYQSAYEFVRGFQSLSYFNIKLYGVCNLQNTLNFSTDIVTQSSITQLGNTTTMQKPQSHNDTSITKPSRLSVFVVQQKQQLKKLNE